ncbi:MAG: glycoside hydrolase family 57 protein [Methylococcales bacterium]|nr:glycoside hydrolase family 57 protein [Methylococcales bacterium]
MHQPEYRNLQSGDYKLPWTYLHVIKDYVDMVAHLEATPNAKAVVNFAPILLEQIEDYSHQLHDYLRNGKPLRDSLLAALANPEAITNADDRLQIIKNCKKANKERQIERYSKFSDLLKIADELEETDCAMDYISSQFMSDIVVWYHLAWMGETVKLSDKNIQKLIEQGSNFSLENRTHLLKVISDLLSHVLNRYKVLAQSGQIELSVTPYAHPIVPLMLDIKTTCEAMPDAPLPQLENYPGGEERVQWHLKKGVETFNHFFGFTPKGCWPSEGAVSSETLKILADFGFDWAATGGSVLHNSLNSSEQQGVSIHQPFKLKETNIACFFRDDGLSDLIGFEYSKWHADDAVNNLIEHLENIGTNKENDIVSIIMDGENAWEYFPNNGYHFLNALYKRLADHPTIELSTFSECLAEKSDVKTLNKLIAGSWVYGTFSTWVGDNDKNRGWDMLGDVKKCFDNVIPTGRLNAEQTKKAEIQLAVCEGSDWFWWFGDYNPNEAVSDFEKQFRLNLTNLYSLLGEQPPSYLTHSFTQGSGTPVMGGAMRPGTEH